MKHKKNKKKNERAKTKLKRSAAASAVSTKASAKDAAGKEKRSLWAVLTAKFRPLKKTPAEKEGPSQKQAAEELPAKKQAAKELPEVKDVPAAEEIALPAEETTVKDALSVEPTIASAEDSVPAEAAVAPAKETGENSLSAEADDSPAEDPSAEEADAEADEETDEDDEEVDSRTLSVKPVAIADSLRSDCSVNGMMLDVLITLLPLLAWSVYLFGLRPLVLALCSVYVCYMAELVSIFCFRRNPRMDLAPAVTGVLLALGMPPSAPLWLPALGAVIAVIPVRQLFGGTGKNRLNPAATALAILYIIFPKVMTALPDIGVKLPAIAPSVGKFEAVGTTALDTLLSGELPAQSLGSMFVGLRTGLIGEMSALLLIAGGIYLMLRRIVRPGLPVAFLLTVGALTYLFPTLAAASDAVALRYAAYHLLSGNLLLGVLFMATDPVTSPRGGLASLAAGVIGGAVTVIVRYFVSPHIGVICAVLVINLLARPLDYLCRPAPFGGRIKKTS